MPVKKLTPGMRLARPVVNSNGTVILGEETELTHGLIRKIEEMHITAVSVQGPDRNLPPREQILADLDKRFRDVEAMPHMGLLKRVLADHLGALYEEHECKSPEEQG